METLILRQVETSPQRSVVSTLNTWCTPLTDAVAGFQDGDLVLSDSQTRVRLFLTPPVRQLVRQSPQLEAEFRDGSWRVTGRTESGLQAILTLEPERG